MPSRKHLAQHYYGSGFILLRCKERDFELDTRDFGDSVQKTEAAFRQHRREVGEIVKPEGERSVQVKFSIPAADADLIRSVLPDGTSVSQWIKATLAGSFAAARRMKKKEEEQ